ncbi:hypothetical protein SAMN05216226_12019 [Halovenus aranensis]|uniref:Uncharacterized protein n=1 Tax=Halovenus aranensis TaxID=890420 RepID=A0A1G8ZDC5_9EURY|nr:hypothetical protein [Halovenus aranensis]SDK12405.1 hypothetical protein SAMN05216226_12019 [Halovenus aranensis]
MSIEPKSTTGGIENSNDLPHAPFELVESGRATKRAQHVVATIENDPQLVSDRIAAYISGEVNAEGVRHTDWSQILRYSGGRLVTLSETATGHWSSDGALASASTTPLALLVARQQQATTQSGCAKK